MVSRFTRVYSKPTPGMRLLMRIIGIRGTRAADRGGPSPDTVGFKHLTRWAEGIHCHVLFLAIRGKTRGLHILLPTCRCPSPAHLDMIKKLVNTHGASFSRHTSVLRSTFWQPVHVSCGKVAEAWGKISQSIESGSRLLQG